MKRLLTLTMIAGLLVGGPALAIDTLKPAAIKQSLTHTPSAELPAKAAEFVKTTRARDRAEATVNTVRAALEINPSIAPMLVAAIAKAVPDMASIAAATAAEMQPKQAPAIAKAAAVGAPTRAGRIVNSVCRAVPQQYQNVAAAVAQAVPGSDREVLEGVSSALPALKGNIDTALAGSAGGPVSVNTVLNASRSSALPGLTASPASSGPMAGSPRGPAVGPPFVPLSGTTTNVNPSDSDIVPPGGRNYAAP